MTYVDALESDLSAFHGLEFFATSTALVMRLARNLPVYQGALWLAMESARQRESVIPTVPIEPGAPASEEDTPSHLVMQMQQRAMLAQFQAMNVNVTGVERVGDDEMERLVNGG